MRLPSKFIVLILGVAALFAVPGSAAAEQSNSKESAIVVGYKPSWYVMGGATGGAVFRNKGPSGFAGLEASVVRSHQGYWIGMYTDGVYDFGLRGPILSIGPELGYGFVGLDGGLGLRWNADGPVPGVTGRFSLTAGIFGLYGRYLYWPDLESHAVQVGASFKFPLVSPWGPGSP